MKAANDAFAAWYEGKNDLRGYTTEDGFLAGYAAALRPIPVTERVPDADPDNNRVSVDVVAWNGARWAVGWFRFQEGEWCIDAIDQNVTHWLELPPIPTEEPTP